MGRQWLNLKRRGWSKSGSTDTYGRFDFRHVPAGVYELSFYDSGYKVRTFGPIRVEEGQQVKGIEFKAVPVDAQVAPYTKALQHLLECSGGVNVNQKSFYKAALGQNELWGFDAEELEKGWRA